MNRLQKQNTNSELRDFKTIIDVFEEGMLIRSKGDDIFTVFET